MAGYSGTPLHKKLGFKPMRTAMAIFLDQDRAIREGLVEDA